MEAIAQACLQNAMLQSIALVGVLLLVSFQGREGLGLYLQIGQFVVLLATLVFFALMW